MTTVHQIISDKAMVEVHGRAHFGSTTMRRVLAEGVVKSALGFDYGSTTYGILKTHKLIRSDKSLTKKGKRYAQVLWNTGEFHL